MKRFVPAAFVLAAALADPVSALASITGPGEDQPLNLPSSSGHATQLGTSSPGGGSLARTFVGLAVVVGVIYALYWILKQVKKSREEKATGSGLHTEAIVPLGPNRALHLVRAGRELVLVGVAEQGVVPIRTYTEEEAIAVGLIGDEPAELPSSDRPQGPPLVAAQKLRDVKLRDLVEGLRSRTVRG